jgi:exosortase
MLLAASVFFWWHTLVATFGLPLRNDAYTCILLILPISIALILSECRSRNPQPALSSRAGPALLLLAVLISVIEYKWSWAVHLPPDEQLSLGMLALVTWWIGSFLCCFGTRIFRVCLFPLCLLFWLVPLPGSAVNQVVSFLQRGSADAANLFFVVAGVPVTRDGLQLSIPGLTLEVATECSSIRSSLMLLIVSMVLSHLLLRSFWGKALVIVAAIPLAIAKNGFRIFALSMLAIHVDPIFLTGWPHHQGGITFFLIFVAGLFVLLRLIRWAEDELLAPPTVTKLTNQMVLPKATSDSILQ